MSSIIDSIFTEWRASLPQGSEYPKFTNAYHMVLLKEVCKKHGIDNDVINNVILMLEKEEKPLDDKEREKAKKLGLVSKGFGNWGKDKDGPTTHKTKDGKLVPIGDGESDVKEPEVNPLFQKDGEPDDELIKKGVSSSDSKQDKKDDEQEEKIDYETTADIDGVKHNFSKKSETTDGLFTTAEDGYLDIKTKDGKGYTVRQIKDPRTGKVLDTTNPEDRETAISVVNGKLDEYRDKAKAAVKQLDKKADKNKNPTILRTRILKWLGEYGEMQAYVDLLERGDVTDVHLLTDSEVKNDILVVMEDQDRNIDAYGVSVKTTRLGEKANQRGSSVKGDFIDRLGVLKDSTIKKGDGKYGLSDNVTTPVESSVLVNSMLEIRKQFIRLHSDGKTGVDEKGKAQLTLNGEKMNIATFYKKQKISSEDVLTIFNDEKIFARTTKKGDFRTSGNPIRGLGNEEVDENQHAQLREHFIERIMKQVASTSDGEGITIKQLEDFILDDIGNILDDVGATLLPTADLMVSYYESDGSFSNGFMTKENQMKSIEEKYPNWREMAARDQLREFLGFDFTGRAGGKKKEGTGYVDGQSYARGNPDIQPDPKPVKEYIDSIK